MARNNRYTIPAAHTGNMQEEEMTVAQIVSKAEQTVHHTTDIARQAKKAAHEIKVQQEGIIHELEVQDKQLDRMGHKITQISEDLTYSERLLRYMRRCCCCWMCDSCTGADPESKLKKDWGKAVDKGRTQKPNESYLTKGNGKAPAGQVQSQGGAGTSNGGNNGGYRDPDIRLGDEHKDAELRMRQGIKEQNDAADDIHTSVQQILHNAKVIASKLDESANKAEQLGDGMQDINHRLHNVNNKSQLRDFRK